MTPAEQGLRFECEGESLVGVLSVPASGTASTLGVVIAVGGPQYRAGSHRQFVLLARHLAATGIPVLRFDVRGMGDSTGSFPGFEQLGPDLAASVQALRGAVPEVRRVAIWGLCDAASAALMNATRIPGLAALVLLNPWVRHADTYARTEVKKYYAQRLFDREFWRKLLAGQVQVGTAARELTAKVWRMLRSYTRPTPSAAVAEPADFRERMVNGLLAFNGPQLYILAGRDHTCAEFLEFTGSHGRLSGLWQRPTLTRVDMPAADHTFSSAELRAQVEVQTLQWLQRINAGQA